ncbi:MAG TPA: amidase family protein [Mycobacteriales bacterium]|nr:amidase family protein [Mycobacteriales bacterium]
MDIDLETATVAELRRLLDSGPLTSAALTAAYLARIEALDRLNAIRMPNPTALTEAAAADARLQADGPHPPLLGIPVIVKDNIDVAGLPTTAGSLALEHSFPAGDATLVTALRAAGAVILAKANLTEMSNYLTDGMPGGYSSLGGQVLNPYDVSQTPSGSSAGSAVAAATGLAAFTIGTETSGSILSPAAANSVVGIKPTVGLISRAGIVPIAASQDTAGPMSRTVADAAAGLTALAGIDPADPATTANPLAGHDFTANLTTTALSGARIGVVTNQAPDDGSDARTCWDAALAVLRGRGADLIDVELDLEGTTPHQSSVLSYEFKRDLNRYLAGLPSDAPVKSLADLIAFNDAHEQATLKYRQRLAIASEAKDLGPDSADSAGYAADRAADLAASKVRIDEALRANNLTAMLFANANGAAIGAKPGYPSVSVPAGYEAANRGPFSIMFLGQAFSEPTLVGYAFDYEQASRARRPPSTINPSLFR